MESRGERNKEDKVDKVEFSLLSTPTPHSLFPTPQFLTDAENPRSKVLRERYISRGLNEAIEVKHSAR